MGVRWNHKHSRDDAVSITYGLWLIFDASGNVRSSRGETLLQPGERAMKIELKVPKSIFKMPTLHGTITIEDSATRDKIVADVAHNAAEVLREHLGVDLSLTIQQPSAAT